MIVRKSWLKILGVTFQENPSMWDMRVDELMSKACSRMYVIRICKYYGFSVKELDLLFHSLILSILVFGIEVWGCASYSKYLSQVDKLLKRAYNISYLIYDILCIRYVQVSIVDKLNNKDRDLWEKITTDPNHALQVLLPPSRQLELRNRGHEYMNYREFEQKGLKVCSLIDVFLTSYDIF